MTTPRADLIGPPPQLVPPRSRSRSALASLWFRPRSLALHSGRASAVRRLSVSQGSHHAMTRTRTCWSGRTSSSRRRCLDLLLLLPVMSRSEELPCDQPFACEPIILVPGVMGSRLRSYSRVPGSIDTISGHVWLPESHRLLMRAVGATVGSASQRAAWVNSLMPGVKQAAGKRIEPDRTNWGLKGVACILKTGRECVGTAKVFWDMILHLEKVR